MHHIAFYSFILPFKELLGGQNAHLFQFSPQGFASYPMLQGYYGDVEAFEDAPFSDPETFPYFDNYDAEQITLADYFSAPKQKIRYIYDFGDEWDHIVELVSIDDERLLVPQCIAGKGRAPIEDCGGIWGYYYMVEALNDPKHPEHTDFKEWMDFEKGGDLGCKGL